MSVACRRDDLVVQRFVVEYDEVLKQLDQVETQRLI